MTILLKKELEDLGGILEQREADEVAEVLVGHAVDEFRRLLARAGRAGQTVEQIERDCDRNKWLNSEETLAYGLADTILERMAAPK